MSDRSVGPTPEIQAEVRRLCEGWQDTSVYTTLHALMQANLLSSALQLGNGNRVQPDPDALRIDAADIRCVADGLAQFLEHLAERMEAKAN